MKIFIILSNNIVLEDLQFFLKKLQRLYAVFVKKKNTHSKNKI